MFFMLDNYDSFVYNLSACFEELGQKIIVRRADAASLSEIEVLKPEGIIISPGPKRPSDAEFSLAMLDKFKGKVPILGVCLGHQVIGCYFGAKIKKGNCPMHGKVTPVFHKGTGLFTGLPNRYHVTRYHSLVVAPDTCPDELQIEAVSKDGAVMGISHKNLPVYGVQFHPEAVLTEYGHELIQNFIEICQEWRLKVCES